MAFICFILKRVSLSCLIIFLWFQVSANPRQETPGPLELEALCNKLSNNQCTPHVDSLFRLTTQICEQDMALNGCQKYITENPDVAGIMRSCDRRGLCNRRAAADILQACGVGIKEGVYDFADTIVETFKNFRDADYTDWAWGTGLQNPQKQTLLAQECSKDLLCRRERAKETLSVSQLTDVQIMELGWNDFLTRYNADQESKERVEYYNKAQQGPSAPLT